MKRYQKARIEIAGEVFLDGFFDSTTNVFYHSEFLEDEINKIAKENQDYSEKIAEYEKKVIRLKNQLKEVRDQLKEVRDERDRYKSASSEEVCEAVSNIIKERGGLYEHEPAGHTAYLICKNIEKRMKEEGFWR